MTDVLMVVMRLSISATLLPPLRALYPSQRVQEVLFKARELSIQTEKQREQQMHAKRLRKQLVRKKKRLKGS